MTIRRQYQLPNCSLILDGLSIDPAPGNEDVMSLLVNAECRISGLERSINGGYNFFAALVRAVSQYGQELLSGFAHPQVVEGEPLLVHINPGDGPYHHLVVQPEIADLGGTGDGRAIDIKLSAVQLFDLTEAVDQFFDDRQTLPELESSLTPLPRRFVRTEQPLSDRAVPAVLGVGGLVVAAMALGMLPMPEMRDPALEGRLGDDVAQVSPVEETDSGEPPPGDAASNEIAIADGAEVDADADADAVLEEAIEDTTEDVTEDTTEDAVIPDADAEAEEAVAEEITEDADGEDVGEVAAASGGNVNFESAPSGRQRRLAEVETLNAKLKTTIVANREQPRFGDAVSYRVRFNEAGEIAGYEAVDAAAGNAVDETPLPALVKSEADADEAIDYRVVFTERGVIEVSPWWGWSFYE